MKNNKIFNSTEKANICRLWIKVVHFHLLLKIWVKNIDKNISKNVSGKYNQKRFDHAKKMQQIYLKLLHKG